MSNATTAPHVSLVTGASRGIGRAIAARLARDYAGTVIIHYLQNDTEATKTESLVTESGGHGVRVKANLVHPDGVDALFDEVRQHVDHVDVFVHCAAVTAFKPLFDVRPNQWDLTMNVNARSFLLCAQHLAPMMQRGSMIAISSSGAQRAVPNYGALGVTKAALEATVRGLAAELARRGIRVNGVTGGLVLTETFSAFPNSKELLAAAVQRTPMGRAGTPEEFAAVVSFLAGPDAAWICGQIINTDGGFALW